MVAELERNQLEVLQVVWLLNLELVHSTLHN
jgi:hypothetical protein